jgi:WD40 repeat protein
MGAVRLAALLLFAAAGACTHTDDTAVRVVPQIGPLRPRRVTFSPRDAQRLMVQEASGRIGVWDLHGAASPELFASFAADAIDAAFAPDGNSIVTAGRDGYIRWWALDGMPRAVSADAHAGAARAVAVTEFVASGGDDGTVRLWNADGTARGAPLSDGDAAIVSLAISPRGEIASVAADGALRVWRPDAGAPPAAAHFQPSVVARQATPSDPKIFAAKLLLDPTWGWHRAVVFAPHGDGLAAALFDGTLRLRRGDAAAHTELPAAHAGRHVNALAVAPAGDVIASAGFDGQVRFWNLDGSPHGRPIAADRDQVFSVSFSPGGERLATTGSGDRVRIWSVAGAALAELPSGTDAHVDAVAISPTQPVLAVADHAGTVRVWDLTDPRSDAPAIRPPSGVVALAWSPSGDVLATGDTKHGVALWHRDGSADAPIDGQDGGAWAIAFAGADELVAGGTALERIDGQRVAWRRPVMLTEAITKLAIAPRGDLIVAGTLLGRLQVWTSDGAPLSDAVKLPREHVHGLAFTQGGELIASAGGMEDIIRLWDLRIAAREPPLEGHRGIVTDLAATSDATSLASGSADGTVRLWHLPARQADVILVGMPVDELGWWRGLLWARGGGDWISFYDQRRRLVAQTVLQRDAPLTFTPDGWVAGLTASVPLLMFDEAGRRLSQPDAARRVDPERVGAALRAAAAVR